MGINLLVILPPGTFEGHTECNNVSIIDDDVFEQEQEMFTVNWDYTLNPSNFTGDFTGTVTIIDDEGQILYLKKNWFSPCSVFVTVMTISMITEESVPEEVGTIQVCAMLSGASYTDTPINVMLDTISGMYF